MISSSQNIVPAGITTLVTGVKIEINREQLVAALLVIDLPAIAVGDVACDQPQIPKLGRQR
jgi:hypothetical protein